MGKSPCFLQFRIFDHTGFAWYASKGYVILPTRDAVLIHVNVGGFVIILIHIKAITYLHKKAESPKKQAQWPGSERSLFLNSAPEPSRHQLVRILNLAR